MKFTPQKPARTPHIGEAETGGRALEARFYNEDLGVHGGLLCYVAVSTGRLYAAGVGEASHSTPDAPVPRYSAPTPQIGAKLNLSVYYKA